MLRITCSRPNCGYWAEAYALREDVPGIPREIDLTKHTLYMDYICEQALQEIVKQVSEHPTGEPLPLDLEAFDITTPRMVWYVCSRHREAYHRSLEGFTTPPVCEVCGETEQVRFESSRTCYDRGPPTSWEIILKNVGIELPGPNMDIPLCRTCSAEHHAHWDDMWAEVNRDRL